MEDPFFSVVAAVTLQEQNALLLLLVVLFLLFSSIVLLLFLFQVFFLIHITIQNTTYSRSENNGIQTCEHIRLEASSRVSPCPCTICYPLHGPHFGVLIGLSKFDGFEFVWIDHLVSFRRCQIIVKSIHIRFDWGLVHKTSLYSFLFSQYQLSQSRRRNTQEPFLSNCYSGHHHHH